jgi:hypothetical protein
MAWEFKEIVDVTEPHPGIWKVRILINNGAQEECIHLKFQGERPTNKQGRDELDKLIDLRNTQLREMNKEQNPPNLSDLLTNPQKNILRDSYQILNNKREEVDPDLRKAYDKFVDEYREKLERWFR